MRIILSSVAGLALLSGAALAQTEQKDVHVVQHDVIGVAGPKEGMTFERRVISLGGPDTVEFISTEASVAGKVVKGAPYSAEAVSETAQTLADGNRISKKSTAATYRDSEGRTRRDMTLPAIGAWANSSDAPRLVIINDPVAGASYHLDSKAKTARKMPVDPAHISFSPGLAKVVRARVPGPGHGAGATPSSSSTPGEPGAVIHIEQTSGPAGAIRMRDPHAPKSESLGKQAIDGIEVEGTRSTITIPAGEMGNEREINIVHERWYSPELQTVILSKHTDPRMGETTYKLTQIKRGDPHPSLFQVPSDYKLLEDGAGVRFFRSIEDK